MGAGRVGVNPRKRKTAIPNTLLSRVKKLKKFRALPSRSSRRESCVASAASVNAASASR
jgi:hypothetical protein